MVQQCDLAQLIIHGVNKMKICNKCCRELDENMFNKDSYAKDGLKTICRDCCREYKQKTRDRNLAYSREYNKQSYVKQQKAQYYSKNKSLVFEREKNKKQIDTTYDINCKTIKSLGGVLAGRAKSSIYFAYFGYTLENFRTYFESLFTPEMNWNNYGSVWEIDHVIPKFRFSFSSVQDKQYRICWSLMNLRPIKVQENRSRPEDGSDIPEEIQHKILHQFDREEE